MKPIFSADSRILFVIFVEPGKTTMTVASLTLSHASSSVISWRNPALIMVSGSVFPLNISAMDSECHRNDTSVGFFTVKTYGIMVNIRIDLTVGRGIGIRKRYEKII